MNNKHSGNQYRLSRKHLVAASFITLAGLLILPRAGKTQTVLTTKQAEEKAETLLGKRPDHVDSYFSKEENSQYFAFTLVPESKWNEATNTATPAQEDIWFYEKPGGSNEMRELCQEIVLFWAEAQRSMAKGVANNARPRERSQLWPKYLRQFIRYDLPSGFVTLPGRTSPCLRLRADFGHPEILPGATKRLGLFCLVNRQLSWLDYEPEFGSLAQTGVVGRVKVNDEHAPEDSARRYLLSWGGELGLNVPAFDAASDAPRRLQQRWIDANGRKACFYEQTAPFRWNTWKTDQVDKLIPYATRRLLKDPQVVLNDGRYQWLSYPGPDAHADEGYALASIGRYDTQLQRYDLIYVPDSSYDYSKDLVVIGNWLYIQDCGHWAVRFKKGTHHLERGDFDEVVGDLSTGVYPTSRSNSPATAGALPSTTPRSTEQEPARQKTFIPPGIDPSARDRETIRRNLATITLATPSLFDRLNPLARAMTICEAAGLDQADQDACIYRALLDEQKRQEALKEDSEDFKKRFLNVPHPSVGELRKMANACNVVMWEEDGHRSKRIKVPEGTEVLITWVSGTGNSEGKIASGNYVGRQILFMDSDLAPKSVGHK